MKIRIIYLLCAVVLIICCTSVTTQKVDLFNQPKTIVITAKDVKGVYSLNLEITGYINGKAIIKLDNIRQQIVENKFTFKYNADWYSNEATIYYEPINVYQGNITIKYKFFSL